MKQELPKPTNPHASFYEAIDAWCDGRLLARSGYYAGRGPKRGDLGPFHLELIYNGIKKDYSDKHAALFLDFVEGLTDLSATAFLVAFEYFFSTGCSDPKCYKQNESDQFQVDGHGAARDMQAMCAVFEGMNRNNPELDRMESESIKFEFLGKFGRTPKAGRRKSNIFGYFH